MAGAAVYLFKMGLDMKELEAVADVLAEEGLPVELDEKGALKGSAIAKVVAALGDGCRKWRGRAIIAERQLKKEKVASADYLKAVTERNAEEEKLRDRVNDLLADNRSLKEVEQAHVAELANARERVEVQNSELNAKDIELRRLRENLSAAEETIARLKKKAKRKS